MGGKTSNASKYKYNVKAYDRIGLTTPKGEKEQIQAAAAAAGESVNGYIISAVRERMERETAKPTD